MWKKKELEKQHLYPYDFISILNVYKSLQYLWIKIIYENNSKNKLKIKWLIQDYAAENNKLAKDGMKIIRPDVFVRK